MPKLHFDDGCVIETGGELRRLELYDGLYVVGEGYMIPVKTEEEVLRVIENLKANENSKSST